MTQLIRRMYGGGLRPGDPRRLLVEAMVAAMRADGYVDPEELRVLEANIREHDIFEGLDDEATRVLIEMANDALDLAGGSLKRVDAIARGLPSRAHRLAAYAVACEVCLADGTVAPAEAEYLDALRRALMLDDEEAQLLGDAARRRQGMLVVEGMTREIAALVPRFIDCMALMAAADGVVQPQERQVIRDVLRTMGDMTALGDAELDAAIDQAFARIEGRSVVAQMQETAAQIHGAADRYWAVVYILVVALVEGWNSLRQVRLISAVRDAFAMSTDQMSRAMESARLFSSRLAGPL